ncbi:ANTAR domain-containing protein [Streptomyces sp. NPDC050564]|uniref:ANTAR domain-containing protein n=1 Tax=Streptomyces sp. NPDC050564 TaxID=3365631 RepID=UPI003797CBD0
MPRSSNCAPRNEQLGRALASRAVIDQRAAVALAPCSNERDWDLLVRVSQHCNIKLRDVAAALVATTKDEALPKPIRQELRRALRRLLRRTGDDGVRARRTARRLIARSARSTVGGVGGARWCVRCPRLRRVWWRASWRWR